VAAVTTSHAGIGMTSQRTRMRMVERLRAQGVRDEAVLAVRGERPRHIFIDEALATRAYDDEALPIGFGQTISSTFSSVPPAPRARSAMRPTACALERVWP